MNLVTTWTTLNESDSPDLVLCIDFTATGRAEAGLLDLVALIDHDATFWHVVPPALAPDAGIGAREYVRSWLEPVRKSGRPVRAVMGYCVGAVYAAELVAELAESQDEVPELIVFDPEPTSLENIYFQFGKVFGILSSILSEEDVAEIQKSMDGPLRQEGMTVERYASQLYATFREVGHNAFLRAGLDVEFAEEMWDTFSAFLSFLTYADQLDPWDGWLRAIAVSSSTPNNGLNKLRGEADSSLVKRELRFDARHDEVLKSEEVARAVTKLLEK